VFHFPLDKLVQDPNDVAHGHLPFIAFGDRETWIQLKHFLANDWENLQEEFSL